MGVKRVTGLLVRPNFFRDSQRRGPMTPGGAKRRPPGAWGGPSTSSTARARGAVARNGPVGVGAGVARRRGVAED